MSMMSLLGTTFSENELSRLGQASNLIMGIVNELKAGNVLLEDDEKALFSEALKLKFLEVTEDGVIKKKAENIESTYLGLVDGVNYMQYYLTPSIKNLQTVVKAIDDNGLKFAKSEQTSYFERIKSLLEHGSTLEQNIFIESIASLRLFDAREKHVDLGKALPLSIDIKFKPSSDTDGGNRVTLKVAAVSDNHPTNSNNTLKNTIDHIITEVGGENLGKIYRRFFALKWLPPAIVEYFVNNDERILKATSEKQAEIWELLAEYFSVKLDVRFDKIETPSGAVAYSVTEEAEVDVASSLLDADRLAVGETVAFIHSMMKESFNSEPTGTAYNGANLDANTLAQSPDPKQVMKNVLSKNEGLDADTVLVIVEKMELQVQEITRKFGFKHSDQMVIRPHLNPKLINKDFAMTKVRERINAILD